MTRGYTGSHDERGMPPFIVWPCVTSSRRQTVSVCACVRACVCVCVAGLESIPDLELELELQAMELELELQNGIHRNWNGIQDSISIPPSILFTYPYFLLLMAHIDVLKIADVFFKERICFKISNCKKISVIEL